jgi:hypothetical protein
MGALRKLRTMKTLRLPVPPNKHMQRAGKHKVHGRGRSSQVPSSSPRARVLAGQRAGADVGRWATLRLASGLQSILKRLAFLLLAGFSLASYFSVASAAESGDLQTCSSMPSARGDSKPRYDLQSLMMVAVELETQGESDFHLKYAAPKAPCIVETFAIDSLQVKAIFNPFEKDLSSLLYRFVVSRPDGPSEILVIYSGVAAIFVNKGPVFHVSEERDGVISWYMMYREEPTYAAAKAIATEIAEERASPLMAVRWPRGAKEGSIVALDKKRLK